MLADFNNEAVLDRETGLVWETSPDTTNYNWNGARNICLNKNIGGRKGWRLPAIAELTSLIDPSVAQPGPTLPPGHPFTTIPSLRAYWSVTTNAFFMAESGASDNRHAWVGNFADAQVPSINKNIGAFAWCVRGPMNADQY